MYYIVYYIVQFVGQIKKMHRVVQGKGIVSTQFRSDQEGHNEPFDKISQAGYKVQVIVQTQTLDLYNHAIAG